MLQASESPQIPSPTRSGAPSLASLTCMTHLSVTQSQQNCQCSKKHSHQSRKHFQDFPGGPVARTLLPMQRIWVRPLVGELDPTGHN